MSHPTTTPPEITTQRLVLRPWCDGDLPPFAAMNADPRVMEFLPQPLDRTESDALAERIRAAFDIRGFGLWAVEVKGEAGFIGFLGLAVPKFEAPFTPCIEIGWRLAYEHWGKGYATEGARAVLSFAFERLALPEVVSFTTPANKRSWRVMERIGMTRSPDEDFDHPRLALGHPLRRHLLFRLSRAAWERSGAKNQPMNDSQ
jgi:RimJ/RimL family protein N-acetyltransferase